MHSPTMGARRDENAEQNRTEPAKEARAGQGARMKAGSSPLKAEQRRPVKRSCRRATGDLMRRSKPSPRRNGALPSTYHEVGQGERPRKVLPMWDGGDAVGSGADGGSPDGAMITIPTAR